MRALTDSPRLPLQGNIDLTYRCNNRCRHCWIGLPANAVQRRRELTLDEIRRIAGEARALGCREWCLSGGEPMLRPDFAEIFDCLTRRTIGYTLNTNGTLITPAIARLLKRPGHKMVALYGATATVHDGITRLPGSFAATVRGMTYLKEAGAGFTVQVVPMRGNLHQHTRMLRLARTFSPRFGLGATWLYLSACGSAARNRAIARQRLTPDEVVALDPPFLGDEPMPDATPDAAAPCGGGGTPDDDRLFAACIAVRRDFHVDPYGRMTFCGFIQDTALRYDLRQGTFQDAWDNFIPSLAERVRGGAEYRRHCGSCTQRNDCPWCPVYGYLEQGRYAAPVPYLCRVTRATRRWQEDWRQRHSRYYRIAGLTVRVSADLPLTDQTFDRRFTAFRVAPPATAARALPDSIERGTPRLEQDALRSPTVPDSTLHAPGSTPDTAPLDLISIHHHFHLPERDHWATRGTIVYRQSPWIIRHRHAAWIYADLAPAAPRPSSGQAPTPPDGLHWVAVFNAAHTRARICHADARRFRRGGAHALTLLPSDQILLARVLADRQGCYLHAAGMSVDGHGLVFAGHSGAGKSTLVKLLRPRGTILCDDRVIVRRWPDGFRLHGTWSHGSVAEVSPAEAPLRAVFFLEKATVNRIVPMAARRDTARLLLGLLVRPLTTTDWWEKMLALMERLVHEVPAYRLQFDKSGRVRETLAAWMRASVSLHS